MKAKKDIDLKNFKAFDKLGKFTGKESSYFTVKKGEELSSVLKANGYSEEQISKVEIRIIRGNPHWLEAESKDEIEKLVKVKEEKKSEEQKYDELKKKNKKEQVEMLKKLNAKKIPAYEDDRIKLIMKLEK